MLASGTCACVTAWSQESTRGSTDDAHAGSTKFSVRMSMTVLARDAREPSFESPTMYLERDAKVPARSTWREATFDYTYALNRGSRRQRTPHGRTARGSTTPPHARLTTGYRHATTTRRREPVCAHRSPAHACCRARQPLRPLPPAAACLGGALLRHLLRRHARGPDGRGAASARAAAVLLLLCCCRRRSRRPAAADEVIVAQALRGDGGRHPDTKW